jgi:molybdate transport system regulatory protein
MAGRKHVSGCQPVSSRQEPRLKVWLEIQGRYSFGWGISEILSAVDRTGSIKQAAVSLGKSYRYVWGRIKSAEDTLGEKLVNTQVGGQGERRSSLTSFARETLHDFVAFRDRMRELAEQEFSTQFGKWHDGAD